MHEQELLRFTDLVDAHTHSPTPLETGGTVFGSNHILEFDTQRREPAREARDYYYDKGMVGYPVKQLGNGTLRLLLPELNATEGNTLIFYPNHRKVALDVHADPVRTLRWRHADPVTTLYQPCAAPTPTLC